MIYTVTIYELYHFMSYAMDFNLNFSERKIYFDLWAEISQTRTVKLRGELPNPTHWS